MPRKAPNNPVIATNKKAFHDYLVHDRYEAGIKLVGTEVKSCRERAVTLTHSLEVQKNSKDRLSN